MKKLLTLAFLCFLAWNAGAQLPDNSIAPDFIAKDINGNTFNLYEVIESGKPVIMDVSATWCPPCWSYHNGHAMKDVYEQYGPNGTNELMVIYVEGDPSTNTACLSGPTGCNNSTQGDWVTGTPYPIIDDATIADKYNVGYFPTIYLICPNHLVKEIGQLSAAALKNAATDCPEPVQGTAISVIDFNTDYQYGKICGTQTLTPKMLVVNGGTDELNSVVIELRVNGQLVQTLDYTTAIASFLPRTIEFAPITVTGSSIIKATVKKLNGTDLATPVVKQKSYAKSKATQSQKLTLTLKTDEFAVETYWELVDDQGNVYGSGGNPNVGPSGGGVGGPAPAAGTGTYADQTTITEEIEVPANGCYFLHMVDHYGDGMCGQITTGSYKLTEKADPANVLAEGGCAFADVLTIFGAEGIVGTNNLVDATTLRVFPNPVQDQLNLQFSMKTAAEVQITVTNTLGQVVRSLGTTSFVAGANNATVQTAGLTAGVYVVSLNTTEGVVSRTFSVR